MAPELENSLPDLVLGWVMDVAGAGAEVRSVRPLHGGMSALVHSVSVQVNGETKHFVLRRFHDREWLRNEPDLARHEAESLRRAARTGLPTPQLVAFDETGSECGIPAVLMTRLDGAVRLQPQNMDRWLNGLAQALVRIHALDAGDFPWTYYTYNDVASLSVPSWSRFPELWESAIRIVQGPRPEFKPCFIHRDYHPTNVLWSAGAVSGVVDWVNACRGPAGIDIGHCRLNLARLFGVAEADAFLSAYGICAGSAFRYDPYWDLLSLIEALPGPPGVYPGWTALGVTGLTDRLMIERLDAYLKSLLARTEGA
ncbi:phosphotransferase family protein [Paenibacillus hamazuiensis]|uniref:phosphotransferase family protein n=1 Tax=Paenibacillus hamazuiensis TaxID=2936508 RepID=UPI00200C7DE3|nr:aminoglycoside phosphotransferase family protein [Paenibacillus hamazuiensis]